MSANAVTFPSKRLAEEITSSALSFKLSNIVGWDGVNDITSASFGTVHYITFRNDTNTRIEIMQIDPTTIANYATTGITISLRGLSYDGSSLVEASARKFAWPRNETIVELGTDAPQLYYAMFTLAGAVNASTTINGTAEEATQAELIAGTGAGSTGARLFTNPSLFATSGVSKALISKTDGLLDDSLLALTTAGDIVYSNGTDLVRLAKGTTGYFLEAGASAPQWGGANLAEANTFFGATDITGAEAESLTDSSTIGTLHFHKRKFISASRVQDAANGAVTYAHGLGVTPKWVRASMYGATAGGVTESQGSYDGTNHICISRNNGVGIADTTNIIQFYDSGGTQAGAVTALDATNVTITWTKTSSPGAGTMVILLEAGV